MASTVVVTAAAKAATSKSGRKIIVGIVVAFLLLILFIVAVIANMLSIFAGEEYTKFYVNAQGTKVYKEIREIYDEYVADIEKEMDEIEEEIEEDNTETEIIEEYNYETGEYEEIEIEYCTVDVKQKKYEYIPTAYVMAYLSSVNKQEYVELNKVRLRKEELVAFWDKIGGIKVQHSGSDYKICNSVMSLNEVAEIYFEDEMERNLFIESFYMINQFIGEEDFEKTQPAIPANVQKY